MFVKIVLFCLCNSRIISTNSVTNQQYKEEIKFNNAPYSIALPLEKNSKVDGIIGRIRLEHREFFHLFNVHYLICFFAAKGKWPFIPPGMQVQVSEIGRTFFTRSDYFIRTFCKKYFTVDQCYRPANMIAPPTAPPALTSAVPRNTDIETVTVEPETEAPTTICTCSSYRKIKSRPSTTKLNKDVFYFDKNQIGNVSSETIINTIEFLQSFLPRTTIAPSRNGKRKKKTKITINVSPQEDSSST